MALEAWACVAWLGLITAFLVSFINADYSRTIRTKPERHVQVVVARYAEDLSWLRQLPFTDVVVYDKNDRGDESHGDPPAHAVVKRLPNVGRESHTYLHHILTNWDALADVTLFITGSTAELLPRWRKTEAVVLHASRTGSSAFPVDFVAREPIQVASGEFRMDGYVSAGASNAYANPNAEMMPCPHRPFGAFYRASFSGEPPVYEEMTQGVLAVSREHIRQHPRSRYERLIRYLDSHSNPEAVHYFERCWSAVFAPFPSTCYVHGAWRAISPKMLATFVATVASTWLLAVYVFSKQRRQ